MNQTTQRVIALVDMDCFYCQVEAKLNPTLKGKPMAVVQYNQWKGGGIIAVNYEARNRGVTRHMRGDEAKEKCPDIVLVSVPTIRGKADLSNYRDAGDDVAKVFSEFSDCVQRASIDEAYIDLTKAVQEYIQNKNEELTADDLLNTYVVGYCDSDSKSEDKRKEGLNEWLRNIKDDESFKSSDYQLAIGGKIVEKMRLEIFNRTSFHCSAGIAHNKILAKLSAGLHKPKKQTILPQDSLSKFYETIPIFKIRNLGGKLGKLVSEKLSISYMSELYRFSLLELQQHFDEKTSSWLYNIARGIDLDPVTSRLRPESIGCCKNFTGKSNLTTKSEVEHWIRELASEVSERLIKDLNRNKRKAKLLTVSFCQKSAMSRCGPLNSYEIDRIVNDAMELLKKFNSASPNENEWNPPIKFLGLSASKFSEELSSIKKYLKTSKNECIEKPQGGLSPDKCQTKEGFCESEIKASSSISCREVKTDENLNSSEEPTTSNSQPKSSFFMNFLNKKKDISDVEDLDEEEGEDESETMWISLSEVIPDVNQAEADVVEILPEALQKKFRERLNAKLENSDNISTEKCANETTKKIYTTCKECGENIPVDEVLEHSDYHTALKLYSEINKTNWVNGATLIKNKLKEPANLPKRKKKCVVTPSKKMRSITSFFNTTPKP